MTTLRLAGVVRESIVDGPGFRYTVFAQGCPHHCPGCHNAHTWPFSGGFAAEPEKIVAEMKQSPLLRGITLSGGEPFSQPKAMAELAALVRAAGYDVFAYTGYLFEELLEQAKSDQDVLSLLQQTDVLIDGPFLQEQKSYDLRFRGSKNQRAIDVKASLSGGVTLADI
ncbi:MAG TPA: anaerobic ribonucleoside-triphosphate reductase activating protein [Feifaniaceae bacterium]|nr:anaerobic ribonucleoside-triphosphate reductase activating protein [Feifaniaceae bacterium]